MTYSFVDARGNARELDGISKYEALVVGEEATGDPDLVLVFPAEDQFLRWAKRSPVAERVDQVMQTLSQDVLPEQANEAWVQKMQTLALKRTQSNFRAFAGLLDLGPNDEEVIRLAMIDRTPLTPSLFDPILLWDRRIEFEPPQGGPQDARTRFLPVPSGFWPILGWVGWDNRPRSARVFGLNVLCENNWFGGRRAWLFGFNMLLNLDRIAFDSITSSVMAF